MENLRIDWTFCSPIILSDSHPLHLDALLAFVKVKEAEADEEENPYEAQEDLPLEREGDVWKASQVIFERAGSPFMISMIRQFEGERAMLDFNERYAKEKFLLTEMQQGSGPHKGYDLRQWAFWAKGASAWCVGDKREVEELLSEISYLGKLTRNGFGKVKSVTITQDDRAAERWSLRVLPREHKGRSKDVEYVDVASPVSPPYWDKLKQVAAVKPMFLPGDSSSLRA